MFVSSWSMCGKVADTFGMSKGAFQPPVTSKPDWWGGMLMSSVPAMRRPTCVRLGSFDPMRLRMPVGCWQPPSR